MMDQDEDQGEIGMSTPVSYPNSFYTANKDHTAALKPILRSK